MRALDPECPSCGHLGTYHDMPGTQRCIGKVGAPLDVGSAPCTCTLTAAEIPGWEAFKIARRIDACEERFKRVTAQLQAELDSLNRDIDALEQQNAAEKGGRA